MTIRIALVYPELLGTYGDGGNALVLAARARWRGLAAEVVEIRAGTPVPAGLDIYLYGGGEDDPQALAAAGTRASPGLRRAVEGGATVLAVCAGLQVLGAGFPGTDGRRHAGAELVDLDTVPGTPRAVGDLVVAADPTLGLPLLYGYENHGGRTLLGPDASPFGAVRLGLGNGHPDQPGVDGAIAQVGAGRVLATYLHGPVLAQNPALADLLLTGVVGTLPPWEVDPAGEPAAALRRARARQTRVH
ncbi:MAG TPA: glutamine amidotransferase [Mycobacteriales bacterium]